MVESSRELWIRVGRAGVNADVIDQHLLREDGGRVRVAGPSAANGEVEDEKELVVEGPRSIARPLCAGEGDVIGLVNEEANGGGIPFDGIDVEVVIKMGIAGQGKCAGEVGGVLAGGGIGRAVERAVYCAGLFANVLHDVYFAAAWPAYGGDVVAEHPKSGPHALPLRDFYAGLKTAVDLAEKILRLDAGGSVLARRPAGARGDFFLRGDYEIAGRDVSVLRMIGVELEFFIAPAFATEIVGPFGGIGEGAVRGVEFVAPDEVVTWRGGGW